MEQKLNIIRKTILEKIECEAIVLFGSYARGTQNNESDIDIAIKPKNEVSKKEMFYLSQEIEDRINIEVDLIHSVALENGTKFSIREGGRTVGAGVVTEIIK